MSCLSDLAAQMTSSHALFIHGHLCRSHTLLTDILVSEIQKQSAELVFVDTDDNFERFRDVDGLIEYADGKTLITRVLSEMAELAEKRLNHMTKVGAKACTDPHRYIIIDDLLDVLYYAEDIRLDCLWRILEHAKQTNIHVIIFSYTDDHRLNMEPGFFDYIFLEDADSDMVERFILGFDVDSITDTQCLAIFGNSMFLVDLDDENGDTAQSIEIEKEDETDDIEDNEDNEDSEADGDDEGYHVLSEWLEDMKEFGREVHELCKEMEATGLLEPEDHREEPENDSTNSFMHTEESSHEDPQPSKPQAEEPVTETESPKSVPKRDLQAITSRYLRSPSLFIHGSTGQSRDILMNALVTMALNVPASVTIADTNGVLRHFANCHQHMHYFNDHTESCNILAAFIRLTDERLHRMAQAGETTCRENHCYLFISDLDSLLSKFIDTERDRLLRIIVRARQTNLHVIVFSTRTDQELRVDSFFANHLFIEGADKDMVERFDETKSVPQLGDLTCLGTAEKGLELYELTGSIPTVQPPPPKHQPQSQTTDATNPAEDKLLKSRKRTHYSNIAAVIMSVGTLFIPLSFFDIYPLFIVGLIVFAVGLTALLILQTPDSTKSKRPNKNARRILYQSVTSELARIDSLEGHDFEYYVARLLQAHGFENVSVTQGSGDYGVDIIAYAGEEKIAIQCKHYAKPVGIKAVQEVYAGKMHYNAAEAVVVTNSTFTDAAFTLAQETGVRLWDRDSLKQMLTEIIEREKQAANISSK